MAEMQPEKSVETWAEAEPAEGAMSDRRQWEEAEAEVVDSPVGWVAEHIRAYVESNGQKGHLFHGMPTLLLTTRGRRSGVRRRTALIYGEAGDTYLVVASNGGLRRHPGWYLNLTEDPAVDVQIGAEIFRPGPAPPTTRRSRCCGSRWCLSSRPMTSTRPRPAATSP